MEVKSPIIGIPEILLPKAIGSLTSFFWNFSYEIISLRETLSLVSFGISIPTVFLPGITDTLAEVELVLRAKSSDKFIILETLTPGAGSNSYKLTTGPLLMALILPSIPKSNKIFSMNSPSGRFLFKSVALSFEEFFSR